MHSQSTQFPTIKRDHIRNLEVIASYLHYVVLFGAPLFLLSILLLIIVTIYIVPPYFNANGFTQTTCKVVKIEQSDFIASCSAGTDPFTPCVKVFVSFATGDTEYSKEAIIMENEEALLNCQQCSYTFGRHSWLHSDVIDCETWKENFDSQNCINQFLESRFGSFNRSYSCYFNPLNHSQVIFTNSFDLNMIIHGYIWPLLLCILYGSMGMFVLYSNNQRHIHKNLALKKTRRNGDIEIKREWKKKQLNKCLGIQPTGRDKRQQTTHQSNAPLEALTASQLIEQLPDCAEQHDDMRHLDLAVTEQNIDDLASTFAYFTAQHHASTLPRKSSTSKTLNMNNYYSTLPTTLKLSKTKRKSTRDYWNEIYEHRDVHDLCIETVSVTTSNMLTEHEIDALYKAHARSKGQTLSKKKSETAV